MPLKTQTRVMYLNPVGTAAYDQVFADMAQRYKYPGTESACRIAESA